jgi:hypothetical protein
MSERVYQVVLSPYSRCYVYVHFDPRKVRPDDKSQIDHIVYVGKGTRERAWADDRTNSSGHSLWLRDLQYQGFSPDQYVQIMSRNCTEEQALKTEQELLNLYRSKGVLLFNNEPGYKGPVRNYQNKSLPEPTFGGLRPVKRPELEPETLMTEERFKSGVKREEDETGIRRDVRSFEDQQNNAVVWYLSNLLFACVNPPNKPLKPVAILVDQRFMLSEEIDSFLDRLTEMGIRIEVRRITEKIVGGKETEDGRDDGGLY